MNEGEEMAEGAARKAAETVEGVINFARRAGKRVGHLFNKGPKSGFQEQPGITETGLDFRAPPVDGKMIAAGLRADPKDPGSRRKFGRIG